MESTDHKVPSKPPLATESLPALYPLVAVVGPTGAGKSQLALRLAKSFDGEIVNCDSIQVYRGLDIGSAKIRPAERAGILHHLLDTIDLLENSGAELTAGAYAREARKVLDGIQQRNKLPIIVGGTGFYLRALLDGLSPAPARDEKLRARLRLLAQRRPAGLHRFLRRIDPAAAARIHPNDHQKLIRAIEMACITGTPASVTQSLPREPLQQFRVLKVGLNPERSRLYQALNDRAYRMFSDGLLAETANLLDQGIPTDAKPLQSLGYKQAVAVLTGGQSLESAITECQTRTRQYAKRQLTWFRADSALRWLDGFGTDETVQNQVTDLVGKFLSEVERPT